MSAFCTVSDLYSNGLPRGILSNPARLIADTSTTAESFTLDGHGFDTNDIVRFRAEAGGSLPSPIVDGTAYYAIPLSASQFQVSLTSSGAPVNLTTAGTNVVVVMDLPLTSWIEWASAMVENFLPAHCLPLIAPYPEIVVTVTASLAAAKGLQYCGGAQVDITAKLTEAQQMLTRWGRGIPVRGGTEQVAGNVSITRSASSVDPRGWSPYSGRIP